ncbi:MAG: CDP-alcohol phosphatidyltransferase family protein [Bacteroidales bacterium]|nr:CDP-alcohol phosphatidyltransferase family protein [Bacteroidales bacterium]
MTEADKIQYRASLKHPDVEEPIDLWFYRPVGFRVALLGRRLGWTPNQITIASIVLGIGCGILCYPQDLWLNLLAIVLLILADIGDSADGQLARLTHQYSQLGRILDGAAGDFWFAAIYIAIALRLTPEWGIWCWILAIVTGACHAQQAAMADYYRQFHLFCVKGEQGSELDDAKDVARQYSETKFSENPVLKVFLWFYRNYTAGQERITPQLQKLRKEGGERFWQQLREQSLPLMPIANALTFNCRAITLFIALMLGMPWLYWVVELTLFNVLCLYMVYRHESMCRKALLRLEGLHGR